MSWSETVEARLAFALLEAVQARLEHNNFVRLPQLVTPLPIGPLVAQLLTHDQLRVLVLAEGPTPDDPRVTQRVEVAIDWRNEPSGRGPLVILGDLERRRASGFADVATVRAREVRQHLYGAVAGAAPGAALARTLNALAEAGYLTDLRACAAHVQAAVDYGEDRVVTGLGLELWRLTLLPDDAPEGLDAARLARNASLTRRLRSSDATTLRRLVRHIGATRGWKYEALRRFAQQGHGEELSGLTLQAISGAFIGARSERVAEQAADQPMPAGQQVEEALLDALSQGLEQFEIAGRPVRWNWVPAQALAALACGPDGRQLSAARAGWDESGRAVLLDALAEQATQLGAPTLAEALREIIARRGALGQHLGSLPYEAARLFAWAPSVAAEAQRLVAAWTQVWSLLSEQAPRLRPLASQLAWADLTPGQGGVTMLALHPLLLGEALLQADTGTGQPDLGQQLPHLTVKPPRGPLKRLRRSGGQHGLPRYVEHRSRSDLAALSPLIQAVDHYLRAYPRARLGLAVGLVEPAPHLVEALMLHLGRQGVAAARVDVIGPGSEEAAERGADALETLSEREVGVRERYQVRALTQPDGASYHLLAQGSPARETPARQVAAAREEAAVARWTVLAEPHHAVQVTAGSAALSALSAARDRALGARSEAPGQRFDLARAEESWVTRHAASADWLLLVRPAGPLIVRPQLGPAELLGYLHGDGATAAVFGTDAACLLDPLLAAVSGSAWIKDDDGSELRSLLRAADPRGLLACVSAPGVPARPLAVARLTVAAALRLLAGSDRPALVLALSTPELRGTLHLGQEPGWLGDVLLAECEDEPAALELVSIFRAGATDREVIARAESAAARLQALTDPRAPAGATARELLRQGLIAVSMGGASERSVARAAALFSEQPPTVSSTALLIDEAVPTETSQTVGTVSLVRLGGNWLAEHLGGDEEVAVATDLLDEMSELLQLDLPH